jgi:hypothetical protein
LASRQDSFPDYPRDIQSRTPQRRTEYRLSPDFYAVQDSGEVSQAREDVVAILNDGDHTIEVFRGSLAEPRRGAVKGRVRPVYTLQPGLLPAVPTGQVFISFKDGIAASERRTEIERAGYVIVRILDYAPQAVWLKARTGKIEDALNGLAALEEIADLVTIEPQMLIQKSSR